MQKHIFSMRKHKLTFSPVPASLMQKARICPIEGFLAAFGGPGVSVPTDRGKRGQDTKYGFLSPLVPAGEHRQSPRRWEPTSPPPDVGSPYGVISPVGKYFAC